MIRLRQVEKAYRTADRSVPVLREVSFDVAAGQFCAVTGPSGSGKSTLLNLVGLLDRPTAGSIALDGQEVATASADRCAEIRNRALGFVFQAFHLLPRLTAWENVALPLLYRGVPRARRRPLALAMLETVGLADRADHRPSQMSGGQCQRVAVARALIGEPRLILADEPTGSLDSVTAGEIMELLRDLNRRLGVTVLMVTHDRDLAGACQRRIEMLDGRVVADTAAA
ncbi:macrolide ABC transporter ATP-binding protein [Caulobacter sp. CCUG 60055]|uniref:ABC transporter ATP-binding protein n=1 Tax=Caulobacter sp. CCUG 60055 TaxID=2100090 RepID=UPI001FA7729D|nr:ABC transporter ATP-binding protein [Caulobacter sp. CCUG 60055]MBQ1543180.1 ABC transporter ATP-binding protein [Caulobacteraceae bacterium]MCI3179921.1 macrolide ABC transporter ATP-binding protein [Caulobacter sp. CCUG 60055]